ncbi:MAG: DUF2059 domain-containing protein [Bradymonadaceae bacterium]
MYRRLSIAVVVFSWLGLAAPVPLSAESNPEPDETAESESASAENSDSETSAKREDIRRLLKITGTPKLGLRIARRIIENMKRSYPDVPDKFWAEFEDELSEDAFISIIVPIYEKQFTHEDVKKLIEFYKTDVGQKYVEKLPTLTEKSMQAGRNWGRKLGQKIVDKLQANGYQQ